MFNPKALGDEIDRLWPGAESSEPPAPMPVVGSAEPSTEPAATGSGAQTNERPARSGGDRAADTPPPKSSRRAPLHSVDAPKRGAEGNGQKRFRPPEALLSGEVYDALYQHQHQEKRARGLARPMGVIVLDAIEKHASRLQVAWTKSADQVGEGALFERPVGNVVPPRRRHAVPARNIVLSGVTPANADRLDALVKKWGSVTRSALVEQALRYEFNLT